MVGAPIKPTNPAPQPPPKPRVEAPKRESSPARRNGRPPAAICVLISLWIVWHFSAIFLASMAIPGPTSPVVGYIAEYPKSPVALYLNALYLNHGQSFFAPEVGPCHVLRYALFDRNNQRIGDGLLPDRDKMWPRLYYHRFLMLADQIEMYGGPDAEVRKRQTLEAFARQLLRENRTAQTAQVQLYAHYPLPMEYMAYGREEGYKQLAREFAAAGQANQTNAIGNDGWQPVGQAVQRRTDLPPEPDPTPEPEKQSFAPALPPNPNLNWKGERPNVANRWQQGGVPRR